MKSIQEIITEIERERDVGKKLYFGLNIPMTKQTANLLKRHYANEDITLEDCGCKKSTYDVFVRFKNFTA